MRKFIKNMLIRNHPGRVTALILAGLLVIGTGAVLLVFLFPDSSAKIRAIATTTIFGAEGDNTTGLTERIRTICMKEGIEECYQQQLASMVEKKGFREALLVLDALQLVAPETQSCHLIAHRMALAAIERNPTGWKELVRSVPAERCGGGFIHGAIEGVSFEYPRLALTSNFITQACASEDAAVDKAEVLRENSCAHISGHLAFVESYMDLEKALSICAGIPQRMRYDCYSGVFMETYTRENLAVHGLADLAPWDEDAATELEQHCLTAYGMVAKACWGEVPQLYIRIAEYDPPLTYQLCSQRVPSEYLNFCYAKSSGLLIVEPAFDRAKTPSLCNPFFNDGERMRECIAASVSWLIFSSTELTPNALSFCEAIVGMFRETCYREIGLHLNALHITAAERKRLCANAPDLFRFACEGKAD